MQTTEWREPTTGPTNEDRLCGVNRTTASTECANRPSLSNPPICTRKQYIAAYYFSIFCGFCDKISTNHSREKGFWLTAPETDKLYQANRSMRLSYHTLSARPEVERQYEAGPDLKISKLGPLWHNFSSKAPPPKCSVTIPKSSSSWGPNVQTHDEGHFAFIAQYHFAYFGTQFRYLVILNNPELPDTIPWHLATHFPSRSSDWMFISGLKMHNIHLWKTCPFPGIPLKYWGWKPQHFLATEQWTFTQSLKSHLPLDFLSFPVLIHFYNCIEDILPLFLVQR